MSKLDDALNQACDARDFQSKKQWEQAKVRVKSLFLELVDATPKWSDESTAFAETLKEKVEQL